MDNQQSVDLLNNSDSLQDVQVKASENKEVVTEVTSLAKEEQKSGVKVQTPTAEELVTRASSSMIVNTKRISDLIHGKTTSNKYKISRKAMNRILLAALSIPTEGLPVTLKTEEERLAFGLCQRLISDRFILTQFHISEEMKKQKEKQNQTVKTEGENNEQS